MGRVLLALLALGALLALTLGLFATRGLTGGASTGQPRRSGPDGRYRPRRRGARARGEPPARTSRAVVRRSALAHLRDALTGGPLDAGSELFRCADCQSFYDVASVRALANDNAARCINCGSIERIVVEVVD